MIRKIGIVSAKGGVGKTSVTINLSAALMSLNKNTIAIDADTNMSGLSLQLGMYHFPVTLNDILRTKRSILEAMYIHSSGLRIIPASLNAQRVNISNLSKYLQDPGLTNNIIMIDAPPGLDSNALAIPKLCDELIVVTLPEIPSVVNALKNIKEAHKRKCKVTGIVLNRYDKKRKEHIRPHEIESTCEVPVIGTIPEDKIITKSLFARVPAFFLDPYAPASIEFGRISSSLVGERYREPKNLKIKRFVKRLKK